MAKFPAVFDGIHLPGGIAGEDRAWCFESNIHFTEETSLLVSGCYPLTAKPCNPLSFSHPSFSTSTTNTQVSFTQTFRTVLEIMQEEWCKKKKKYKANRSDCNRSWPNSQTNTCFSKFYSYGFNREGPKNSWLTKASYHVSSCISYWLICTMGPCSLRAGKHLRGHSLIPWISLPRSSQTLYQQESQTLEA